MKDGQPSFVFLRHQDVKADVFMLHFLYTRRKGNELFIWWLS